MQALHKFKVAVGIGIIIIGAVLLATIVNTEQKIWFEIDLTFCQKTPWDEWMSSHPNGTNLYSGIQPQLIKSYFQELGITIFDMKTTFVETTIYMPCDSQYAVFFLVSESDADKMTKLGYKIAKLPLPPNTRSIGY